MAPPARSMILQLKATRPGNAEIYHRHTLLKQRDFMLLTFLFFYVDGYEADDVIGTLAEEANAQGFYHLHVTLPQRFRTVVSDSILYLQTGKIRRNTQHSYFKGRLWKNWHQTPGKRFRIFWALRGCFRITFGHYPVVGTGTANA